MLTVYLSEEEQLELSKRIAQAIDAGATSGADIAYLLELTGGQRLDCFRLFTNHMGVYWDLDLTQGRRCTLTEAGQALMES